MLTQQKNFERMFFMKVSKKVLAVILSVLTVMGAFSVATPVVAAEEQAVYDESMLPIAPEPTEEDLSLVKHRGRFLVLMSSKTW